jgi:hypothetical protein
MKQIIFASILLTISVASFPQSNFRDKSLKADSFLKANNTYDAYKIYKEIQPQVEKNGHFV